MTIVVALDGTKPQDEREAAGVGLIAIVGREGDPLTMDAPHASGLKPKEWHKAFDKAYLLDPEQNPAEARAEALELVEFLSDRARLVIVGRRAAEAFDVWQDDCYGRWRWASWSAIHQGLELADNRAQLFAVVPSYEPPDFTFWIGLTRAYRAGKARMNQW